MATKDTFSSSKNKQQQFVKNSTNNDQHFNLNLNESFKCPEVALIQSQSNSYGKKAFDKGDSAIFDKEKSIIRGWNKSTDSTAFNSDNQKEVKKARKSKSSSNDTNNSTLSLHIAAFENSYEDAVSDSRQCEKFKSKDKTIMLAKNAILVDHQNVFDFPRQQNSQQSGEPEVTQFRASQRLLNPNSQQIRRFVDRRIPLIKRLRLMELLNAGYSLSRAAKRLGISKSGAEYARKRVAETHLLRNREAPKPVLDDYRANLFITQQIIKKRKIKTKELYGLCKEKGFTLSLRQLRYRMRVLGFTWRKMKRVQVISRQNQKKRLEARQFWESEGYPFSRYLFVDECTVVLGRDQQWCWVRKGERVPCQGRVKHGEGFHVFAGISWFGATDILIWRSKSRMNSAFYCAHNIKDIVSGAKSLFPGEEFELVQDSHKVHISIDTLEYLKELLIKTFAWPPQSPDWNPIEFVWRDLKEFIAEREPTSLGALKDLIMEFWSTVVTPSYCRKVLRLAMNNIQKSVDGLNHEKDTARDTLYQK